ncbi:MAG: hypothetical protein AAFY11_12790 [Cyanobacteria bacterium J06641_5]
MKHFVLGLGALSLAFGLGGWGAPGLQAQSVTDLSGDDDPSLQPAGSSRTLSDEALSNPVRLLQQLQTLPSRSVEDFAAEQDGLINDASAEFRRQQLERLGCGAAATGSGSVVNPACTPQ